MGTNGKPDSVDKNDVEFFSKLVNHWWDKNGRVHVLHEMNEIRVPFVEEGLLRTGKTKEGDNAGLSALRILDVGCGGGILAEKLATLGYTVTGIDPGEQLVSVGKKHAAEVSSVYPELKLDYEATTIEEHAEKWPAKYDAVVASEVVEHVTDPKSFLHSCVKSLKPGGSLFISTINRTFLAWVIFILLFEYVLRIIPLGTHMWSKFITPKEIDDYLKEVNCRTELVKGIQYVPYRNKWYWIPSIRVSYILHAVKY